MKSTAKPTIFTIGHSTRTIEEFLDLLFSFDIKILADIRRLPGSRKYPQFDQDALKKSLEENGIEYVYIEDLGGRRKVSPDSKNTAWRNKSFQGYADYMETESFENGIKVLEKLALEKNTAMMCSEAVWWRCHRSMVSDYLKSKGWEVLHIMALGKATEHPYTSPARVLGDQVFYSEERTD
ncbi:MULTISPECIES: DUF488 family protein [unclassified Kaistella]|uniref:DUF488 domain-containing protein n=1 Tax=unclassified Kaistella TaxID=2762626 RepID=UPI002733E986|nr:MULTISPECIES: DUF488 domain-containing protein [unclassified Kaistella]MDP2453591.1 DUF488 domain-containing protein [Kaistella sp. SH11-4b]MDP2456648.1 DUF488 domain-containing protein [Kaistella sp. SH40-3]MDP2459404.1 DUF488 domain-containing protein [Kaistella sp. SH19-2b]